MRRSMLFVSLLVGFAASAAGSAPVGPDSLCGNDDRIPVACAEAGTADAARRVARLVIPGGEACTGWLVSCESHLATAAHCLPEGLDPKSLSAVFLDRDGACGVARPSPIVVAIDGVERLSREDDVLLLRLDRTVFDPAAHFGWFDLSFETAGAARVPQHPNGGAQRSAEKNGGEPCHFRTGESVVLHDCDTSAGASGAPILAASSGRAVALHVRGSLGSACESGNEAIPSFRLAAVFGALPTCTPCPSPARPSVTALAACGGAELSWRAVAGETYRVSAGDSCASLGFVAETAEGRFVDVRAHHFYRIEAVGACGTTPTDCFSTVPGEAPTPADVVVGGDCEARTVHGAVYPGATQYELLRGDGGCGSLRPVAMSETPDFLDETADPARAYGYAIRTSSACGRSAPSACVVSPGRERPADRAAPPTVVASCGSMLVSWKTPTQADRTELERSFTGCTGPWLPVAATSGDGAFVDREFGGGAVAYRVASFSGCSRATSDCVELAPAEQPPVPSRPNAVPRCRSVEVTWPAVGVEKYLVERAIGDEPFEAIALVEHPGFTDQAPPHGAEVRYRVRGTGACPGVPSAESAPILATERCSTPPPAAR